MRPVQRVTIRRQRVFASGAMPIVTRYSSEPAT